MQDFFQLHPRMAFIFYHIRKLCTMKGKIILAALTAATLMTSCVSSKKYKEELSNRERLQKEYAALQADYNTLKSENDKLASNSTLAIKEKEDALNKEAARLNEMKDLIEAQRDAIRNLKKEVCSALKCFTPDELSVEVKDGKLYVSMSDKLLFPSGSDQVNKRGREAISMLAAVLNNSDLEIMVEGHTDNVPIRTGRNKDNWDLSVHRATTVTRIMTENGIPRERIIASGRGEFHPVADNSNANGRQLNRRTEIVLAPRLDKLWKLTEQTDIASTPSSE
jgi:chemotaxis protein MotB